jgi:hypothetical protein
VKQAPNVRRVAGYEGGFEGDQPVLSNTPGVLRVLKFEEGLAESGATVMPSVARALPNLHQRSSLSFLQNSCAPIISSYHKSDL